MPHIIHLHDLEIKSLSHPHNDLPLDMQMSAQLIVDKHIIQQTVPVNSKPSPYIWELETRFEIPEHAHTFSLSIIRHSKARGTRLLGYIETTRDEGLVSGVKKISLCLNLTKVNTDGPSLELRASISVFESSAIKLFNVDIVGNEIGSIANSDSPTIAHHLLQMDEESNCGIQTDTEELWLIHERILFLPSANDKRAALLNMFGDICLKRWKASNMIDHLNQSVYAYEDAVRDGPTNAMYLGNLGIALFCRFQQLGDVNDINKAVLMQKDVLCLTADDHSDKPDMLNNLGTSLLARFEQLSDLDDLNEGISAQEEALQLIPDGHRSKPILLTNLGNCLQSRFEQFGDLNDLNECILKQKDAVHLTPDGHPDRPTMLHNLCNSLSAHFKQVGDLNDLNEAISKMEDMVCLTQDGHPDKPSRLNNLGNFLLIRFEQFGDPSDLAEGISKHEDAIHLTPDGHPDKPGRLRNLGSSLRNRFELLGNLVDLNESISMLEDAIHMTPDCHADKPDRLASLSISLQTRFEQLGDLSDLNECISKLEDAVCLTQDGHPEKPRILRNFGNALLCHFDRLENLDDLHQAISKHEDAVRLTPDGHPDMPVSLNDLANSLLLRFKQLGHLHDLNESISKLEDAVRLTPDGDSGKPSRLNNLGISLHTRFVQLGDFEDLKEGISALKDAVCLTPEGHPDKPKILNNFGNILVVHSNQFHDLNDLQEIICQYTSAACSTTGPAYVRFKAASQWAFSALMEQDPSVLKAYDRALDLLQEVAWLGLSVNDRHHQIIKAGPVVRGAAEAAIFSGQPEKAVELLEQGRSVIWGQLLNLRTPIDALKQKYPDIAQKLIVISAQLEGASTRGSDHDLIDSATLQSLQSIAHQAHNNAYNRDMLLKKIRELEGFQQFLLPKSISELSAALKGPVVFLNVGLALCDALVLMPGLHAEVKHVPLTEFTPEHVKSLSESLERLMPYMGRRNTDRLHGQREGGFASLEDEFAHILSELWVSLAKPVLAVLAITTPTKDCLPRIWWCPTGPLTFLPIHAAGLYGKDDPFGSKLSDFVISSYTPSLAALTQCFRPASESHPELQLLTVAQPSAVGQSYIPGTKDEVNRIQESARGKILVSSLVEHEATIERVEDSMMKSAWVHFACHGVQDKSAPTHSALLLAGSSQLTLERIIKLSLPHADLAFLSACQTATGDKKLQEESVHLAAGMLLAGYRSVIATMWSVMDNDAPQVASDVYEYLFKTSPPDSTQAAEALHLAVGNLREGSGGKKSFFHWVPFIHVGA